MPPNKIFLAAFVFKIPGNKTQAPKNKIPSPLLILYPEIWVLNFWNLGFVVFVFVLGFGI
jgi:hypothetical protein